MNCTALRSVTIPAGVRGMEDAFYNCTALREVMFLGDSVTKGKAFVGCSSLERVVLPPNYPVDSEEFRDSGLTSATFPAEKERGGGFGGTKIETLYPPANITNLSGCNDMEALEWVVLHEDFKALTVKSLNNCPNLKSVVFLGHDSKFFETNFQDCPRLTVYGHEGSEAEKAANQYGIPFKTLDKVPGSVDLEMPEFVEWVPGENANPDPDITPDPVQPGEDPIGDLDQEPNQKSDPLKPLKDGGVTLILTVAELALIKKKREQFEKLGYVEDKNGHWWRQSYDQDGKLTSYEYDEFGRLQSRVKTLPGGGEEITHYELDGDGNIRKSTSTVRRDGQTAEKTTVCEYNEHGVKIKETLVNNRDVVNGPDVYRTMRETLYDGDGRLAGETVYNESGQVVKRTTVEHYYGGAVDNIAKLPGVDVEYFKMQDMTVVTETRFDASGNALQQEVQVLDRNGNVVQRFLT